MAVNPLKTAAYMETPAHRPWARSERTVGRREASTPGPVVPVTADMVAADVTSHFCKDDLKRLSFSGKQEDADSWQFVLKTMVKHVLGLHEGPLDLGPFHLLLAYVRAWSLLDAVPRQRGNLP